MQTDLHGDSLRQLVVVFDREQRGFVPVDAKVPYLKKRLTLVAGVEKGGRIERRKRQGRRRSVLQTKEQRALVVKRCTATYGRRVREDAGESREQHNRGLQRQWQHDHATVFYDVMCELRTKRRMVGDTE